MNKLKARMNEAAKDLITHELAAHGGSISAAARELGMDRSILSKTCKKLGIDAKSFSQPVQQ